MIFNEISLQALSFSDCEIEKFEFLCNNTQLNIFIDSAWLSTSTSAQLLENGILYFYYWTKILFRTFNAHTKSWLIINDIASESLKDICELHVSTSQIILCGFSAHTNNWLEITIHNPKLHAEFQEASKISDSDN